MKREALEAVGQKYDTAKVYVGTKAENVAKMKREAIEAASLKAEKVKIQMADTKENLVEKVELVKQGVKDRFKAYIGGVEEADEYIVDNEYI